MSEPHESLEETVEAAAAAHPLTGDGQMAEAATSEVPDAPGGRTIHAEAHGHMEVSEIIGTDPPPGDDVDTIQPGNKVGVTTNALLAQAIRDFASACRGCNTRLKVGGGFNATLFDDFAEKWAKRLGNNDETLANEPRK